jgi:hypothetical protein
MKNLLGFFLLFVSGSAFSIPVTWTLQDAVFDDGGAATGSFVYDADHDVFSDNDINKTVGSVFNGEHYQHGTFFLTSVSLGVTTVDQPDLTGLPALAMFFTAGGFIPMTNDGRTLFLDTAGGEGYCAVPDCSGAALDRDLREFVSGSISAVPVPAAVWLFGSALAGLGWLRRKQTV